MARKQSLWRANRFSWIPLVGPQTAKAIIKHFNLRNFFEEVTTSPIISLLKYMMSEKRLAGQL